MHDADEFASLVVADEDFPKSSVWGTASAATASSSKKANSATKRMRRPRKNNGIGDCNNGVAAAALPHPKFFKQLTQESYFEDELSFHAPITYLAADANNHHRHQKSGFDCQHQWEEPSSMLLPSSSSQRQHFNTNTINENRQQDAHTTNGGPLCSPSTITKTNQGPTYDFSVHSCSLSPSSSGGEGDTATIPDSGRVPLGGSLVTHKPRGGFLTKNRMLKKFRSGIGSSSTKKKKSRKAFAI